MEITAYRCGTKVKRIKDKIDIPDELAEKYKKLQTLNIGVVYELLRTGEIVWCLEYLPTRYNLAIIVDPNQPNASKQHLDLIKCLFNQVDENTIKERI